MLKRIYVDNYKCLVNFEFNFDSINLFLGANGSGKSTVLEVLKKLRTIIRGEGRVNDEFPPDSLTRWQTSRKQLFELVIEDGNRTFYYHLSIEHSEIEKFARISNEQLRSKNQTIFEFDGQVMHLYRGGSLNETNLPFDGSRSIIEFLPLYDTQINDFRTLVNEIQVVHIDTRNMGDISNAPDPYPSYWMDNYSSWYQYLSQDQSLVFELTSELKEVIPDFDYFRFVQSGDASIFKIMSRGSKDIKVNKKIYRFAELSDGQRALIALYTLLIVARKEHYVLCIDEPENFLALPEIQPWLVKLYDACNEGNLQAILISHHPELINYLLASPVGYWFERETSSPVRIKRITVEKDGGLPVSELIARGWLNA